MNQAIEILQEVHLIQQEYKDQPQLMVAVLAGMSLFIVAAALCVIAVGSIGLLAGSAGLLKEEKPKPLPDKRILVKGRMAVAGYRNEWS